MAGGAGETFKRPSEAVNRVVLNRKGAFLAVFEEGWRGIKGRSSTCKGIKVHFQCLGEFRRM